MSLSNEDLSDGQLSPCLGDQQGNDAHLSQCDCPVGKCIGNIQPKAKGAGCLNTSLKRPFVKPGYTDDAFAQTASDRLEKNSWILVEHGDEALRTCQRVGLGQKGLQCGNFAKRLKNFGFIQKLFVKDMDMVT